MPFGLAAAVWSYLGKCACGMNVMEISRLEIPARNRDTRLWWTVSIDGQILSDFVRPFSAGDSELSVRMGNDGYPWGPEIICRRAGNTVVWHNFDDIDV